MFNVFRNGMIGNKPVSHEEAVDFLDACEITDATRIEFILENSLPFEIDGAQMRFERIQSASVKSAEGKAPWLCRWFVHKWKWVERDRSRFNSGDIGGPFSTHTLVCTRCGKVKRGYGHNV